MTRVCRLCKHRETPRASDAVCVQCRPTARERRKPTEDVLERIDATLELGVGL